MSRAGVHCPICETFQASFKSYNGRPDAQCEACGSLERHRQLLLWADHTNLWDALPAGDVLHFAPEAGLEAVLRSRLGPERYITADLEPGVAMRVVDVSAIDADDETYALVLCSHVLEHVPEDLKALAELHRVLRPHGLAIITVPILRDETDEDPDCSDPRERLRRFGQADHVRTYGWDFVDRAKAVGFSVDLVDVRSHTIRDERARYGLETHLPWIAPAARELWTIPVARRT